MVHPLKPCRKIKTVLCLILCSPLSLLSLIYPLTLETRGLETMAPTCFYTSYELRTIFPFLNIWGKKNKGKIIFVALLKLYEIYISSSNGGGSWPVLRNSNISIHKHIFTRTQISLSLRFVYGCSHVTVAELNSCEEIVLPAKPEIFITWLFTIVYWPLLWTIFLSFLRF